MARLLHIKTDILLSHIKALFCIAVLICSLPFALSSCAYADKSDEPAQTGTVRLVLADAPGIEWEDNRVQKIACGTDYTCIYTLKEGYTITGIEGAQFKDGAASAGESGVIVLGPLYYPTTVIIKTSQTAGNELGTSPDSTGETDDRIEETAAGHVERNSETSENVTSDSGTGSDSCPQGINVPEGKWVLLYYPNGGIITGSTEEYRTEYFSNQFYLCPNTLPDMDYFTREGYKLIGYNTKPDGSGTYYGPGWNVIMPESRIISLYCVWIKESPAEDFTYAVGVLSTDFQYSKTNILKSGTKYITITGYSGQDKTVVIPEKINGIYVTAITGGAISNSSLHTLIFPKTMQSIAASSVKSCPKLHTVYIYDSVTSMPDNWYTSDCKELQQLFVLARRMPTYCSAQLGTYSIKFEWLMTAPGSKIVLVSGSNSMYGVSSPLLEEKLAAAGYNYSVVNYGQNAGTAVCFYIEVISHFINEGDYLIHAPEFTYTYQFGYNEINTLLWQIFEGAYDAFSLVDTRHYTSLYSSFAAFNKSSSSRNPLKYEVYLPDTVNKWGDHSKAKPGTVADTAAKLDTYESNDGVYEFSESVELITANASYAENGRLLRYRDELNRAYDLIYEAKGNVLFSFGTVAELAVKESERTEDCDGQLQFKKAVDGLLHCERISEPWRYLVKRKYMYDSMYHLNTAGQKLRTGWLYEDIINYFSKQTDTY